MKQVNGKLGGLAVLLFLVAGVLIPGKALAKGRQEKSWAIPIIMEESTVRGKVVILETRKVDRRTLAGLRVQVWEPEENDPTARRRMLHETTTDEDGLFSLPLLQRGTYILMISELRLQLSVVPAASGNVENAEPKILLILLPKDVV